MSHEGAAVVGAVAPAPVGTLGAVEVGVDGGVAGSVCPGAAGAAGWSLASTVGAGDERGGHAEVGCFRRETCGADLGGRPWCEAGWVDLRRALA